MKLIQHFSLDLQNRDSLLTLEKLSLIAECWHLKESSIFLNEKLDDVVALCNLYSSQIRGRKGIYNNDMIKQICADL